MKNLPSFAAAAALSLVFAACGDDSSSNNVEREEESSSSVEQSSSSAEESSSSEEETDLPKGTRAATLDDLGKNYSLGKLFGSELFLATGAKKGVFSIWIPDTAWVGFRSDFENGTLNFGAKLQNGGFAGAALPVADSLKNLFDKGSKIQIVVNEDNKLQYSLNDADFVDLEEAKVMTSQNDISKGDDLVGKVLKCTEGKEKKTYTFYEGRYLVESSDSWEAGFYDIQRSRLLMLPTFYPAPVFAMNSMTVKSDFNMQDISGNKIDCKASDFKLESVKHEEIAGEWIAAEDGYDWTLNLKKNGDYVLDAKKGLGSELNNSGNWDIYGNLLLIKNTACTNPSKCLSGVKGVVSGFDAEKGFNLEHSNTEKPEMPTAWEAPQYE